MPPGFEKLAVSELNEKLPGLEVTSVEKGGLNVVAPMAVALAFHTVLKIPTAVRLRIDEFKSRDFPRLFNKIQSIRWNQFLVSDKYELSVQCSKSRLLNEKRVETAVRDGITRFFAKQPPKKVKDAAALTIHVRFFDDLCSLSIDLSGEPLFKRGYKSLAGIAPIRENLAAALFYSLWRASGSNLETLIDPLCGTGTLLLEAQMFFQYVKARTFGYEVRADWLPVEVQTPEPTPGPRWFYGFDREPKALQSAMESLGSIAEVGRVDKSNWVLAQRDLFEATDSFEVKGDRRALICNPPYGERIKMPKKPEVYYSEMREALARFSAKAMGVIVPKALVKLWPEAFSGYSLYEKLPFENGGIEVVFLVYRR